MMGELILCKSSSGKKVKVCHMSSAHGQEDVRIFHKECMSLKLRDKDYIHPLLRKILIIALPCYYRMALKRFDAVIAADPMTRMHYKKFIHRCVTITNFPILREQEKKQQKQLPYIFFAGGITPLWCHEIIIKAIEDMQYALTLIYGSVSLIKSNAAYAFRIMMLRQ